MKGGGEYECEQCQLEVVRIEQEDGSIEVISKPDYFGCKGEPKCPPIMREDGTLLERCPKAMIRDTEWWDEFFDAWWWKRKYGDWPEDGGWMSQAALFLDAMRLMDVEVDSYVPRRRPGGDG